MTSELKIVDKENQPWIFCTSTNPDIRKMLPEADRSPLNDGAYPLNYSLIIAHALLHKSKERTNNKTTVTFLKKLLTDLNIAVKTKKKFNKPNFLSVHPLEDSEETVPYKNNNGKVNKVTYYHSVVIDKSNGCYPLMLDEPKRIISFGLSIDNVKEWLTCDHLELKASNWTKESQVKILREIPYFWGPSSKGLNLGQLLDNLNLFDMSLDSVSDKAIADELYPLTEK